MKKKRNLGEESELEYEGQAHAGEPGRQREPALREVDLASVLP